MADANKIIGIETKNINKVIGIEGKNILNIGNTPISFTQIPAGLIVFLNDASIPTNWERFTLADDKNIIGAGSTYSIGDQGGSDDVTLNNTSSTGSHAASSHPVNSNFPTNSGGGGSMTYSSPADGNHYHPLSLNYQTSRRSAVMIKAQIDQSSFPINTLMLGSGSFAGLTNNTDYTDKYILSKTSISDFAESKTLNLGNGGNHNHGFTLSGNYLVGGGYARNNLSYGGNHGPSLAFSGTVTENLKRVLLSLWTNASAQFELQSNMIAMWESLTPPDGWILCDGQNSAPDLRDCFIKPVNSGNENTTPQGNNTLSTSGTSTSHSVNHNHYTYALMSTGGAFYANNYNSSNTHSIPAASGKSFIPPYYALSFIMKEA